ncbi:MAG: hypothetical protein OHK0052_21430 [Anaerolineales bacterium]
MSEEEKPTFWNWLFGIKDKPAEGNQPEIPPAPEEPLPPIAAAPPEETTRGLGTLSPPEEAAPPQGIAARARRAAEALLENESLTANLPDEAAQTLLHWGLALSATAEPTEDQQSSLRRFLRAATRCAQTPTPENLQRVLQHSATFYPNRPSPEQQENFINNLPNLQNQPQQFLTQLKTLLDPPVAPPKDTPNAPQAL